jgi:hypothetical protein
LSILALKKQAPQKGAYTMNRLTNYCGKWIHHSGWYPDTKLRLVNRTEAQWGGINPHDQLQTSSELPIQHLNGDLLHYSYYTKADHFKQIAYFSDIASKELYARRVRSSIPKIILKVLAQFIKTYFVKLGFLDGVAGWHIAVRSAYATQQKYQLLRKHWQNG